MLESLQHLKTQKLRDWTTVSSVYHDDSEMQNYMGRLRRDDKATAIRVRFYGQRRRTGDQQLFLERKTHREKWTGEKSCKVQSFHLSTLEEYLPCRSGVHQPHTNVLPDCLVRVLNEICFMWNITFAVFLRPPLPRSHYATCVQMTSQEEGSSLHSPR